MLLVVHENEMNYRRGLKGNASKIVGKCQNSKNEAKRDNVKIGFLTFS